MKSTVPGLVQPSLPGFGTTAAAFGLDVVGADCGSKPQRYTLFQAIFPQPADALRISQRAAELRSAHGLTGELLSHGRLHITLHAIAGFIDTVPQAIVDAAIAASARVACPPMHIVFDHVLTFADSDAFVLRCDIDSDARIARLRKTLSRALRQVGLHPEPSGTPHMTMLYDARRHVAEQPVEPVCWTATRFALVLSHVGISHHQWIRQWALAGRP